MRMSVRPSTARSLLAYKIQVGRRTCVVAPMVRSMVAPQLLRAQKKKESAPSVYASDEISRGNTPTRTVSASICSNKFWGGANCKVQRWKQMTSKYCWSTITPNGLSSQALELGIEPSAAPERIQRRPTMKNEDVLFCNHAVPTRTITEKCDVKSPSAPQLFPHSKVTTRGGSDGMGINPHTVQGLVPKSYTR